MISDMKTYDTYLCYCVENRQNRGKRHEEITRNPFPSSLKKAYTEIRDWGYKLHRVDLDADYPEGCVVEYRRPLENDEDELYVIVGLEIILRDEKFFEEFSEFISQKLVS